MDSLIIRSRLAIAALLALAAVPLHAQAPQTTQTPAPAAPAAPAEPALERPTVGSTLTAETLGFLPTAGNLFDVLETMQADVTADRFYGGGLNTGQPGRAGNFLGSASQTEFRIGDVDVTDPEGSGAPLFVPDLVLWRQLGFTTGLAPIDLNAPGLAVDLTPQAPTAGWSATAEGSFSSPSLVAAPSPARPTTAPAIAEMRDWHRGTAFVTGTPMPGRLGVAAGAAWTSASQQQRGAPSTLDGSVGSAFAHLVFTADPRNEVRVFALAQRARYPAANGPAFSQPGSSTTDVATHVQAAWQRRGQEGVPFRVFGGFTRRERTEPSSTLSAFVVERLRAGPIPNLANTGGSTDSRWSIGARVEPRPRTFMERDHTLEYGVEIDGASARIAPGFSGAIGETVNGAPARWWQYASPATEAHRHATTLAAYVSDHFDLSPRARVDLGLRYDGVHASADGAANGLAWHSLLPRAVLHRDLTGFWNTSLIVGYGRSAYRLPLGVLAYGDPAAPVASVSRWNGTAAGVVVAKVGPGTGGDAAFSRIDPSLARPYTDEVVIGLESRPRPSVKMGLTGIARWERQMLGITNTGVPLASYSVSTVADPGADFGSTSDDRVLPIYNRLPASFGRDQYLLTNPAQAAARSFVLEATGEWTRRNLWVLFGATAGLAQGSAANPGYGPLENDQDQVGALFADPNATTYARGRLFPDRGFTIKLTGIYHFPWNVDLGAIARYQDGQPFSRFVIASNLNQGTEAIRAFANGDSRFTFTGTLDLRLQKRFVVNGHALAAVLDAFNVINLGYEVEEFVVTGPTYRDISAIQPPRAVQLGVRVSF